jgi:hypothetical protein
MKKILLVTVILGVILTSGCNKVGTDTATLIPSNSSGSAYPVPPITQATSYPPPQGGSIVQTSNPVATWTPDSSLGIVTGVLEINNKVSAGQNLYLAPVLKDNTGAEIVASLDRTQDPATISLEGGKFTFINVPPGRYGVIFDIGSMAFLIPDKDGVYSLIITVTATETTDLGIVNINR